MKAVILFSIAMLCAASATAQEAATPDRKRVELTAPGEYTESDCLYVMTKDVVAKGNGFTFKGKNCVVDLGGHTLTFNAERYVPKFDAKASRRSPDSSRTCCCRR